MLIYVAIDTQSLLILFIELFADVISLSSNFEDGDE